MNINCPYSQIELMLGLLSADRKLFVKDADQSEVFVNLNKLKKFFEENAATSENIAKFHGINKEDLEGLSTAKQLRDIYIQNFFYKCLDAIKDNLRLSDVECWAFAIAIFFPDKLNV